MKGYRKYFGKKILWFFITLVVAVILNFILPRLMPADPVAAITGKMAQGVTDASTTKEIYERFQKVFGTDKPIVVQFFIFVKNALRGDFGFSFSQYPRTVSDIIGNAIPWTLALQLPAIIIGWLLGNLLGALAAYIRKGFDKVLMPLSMFFSAIPAFGMAVILLVLFAVRWKIAPVNGGYDIGMIPTFSWNFVKSVIAHYQLPFLGISDRKIVGYVFRNAMLPQITGLALSIGTMMGGALVAEIVFSYPGLGSTMYKAVTSADYPLISATTLIITIMVLLSTFFLDIIYGFIDPRVKAAQFD